MERILVVDDEIHVVRLLQKYLASKEYEVYNCYERPGCHSKSKRYDASHCIARHHHAWHGRH